MYNRARLRSGAALALVSVLLSGASMAAGLEEVVVTAQRRAQNIQDVPLSIAAIGGTDVGTGKITGLDDIAANVPGVAFTEFNVGEANVYIRGIGNSSDSAASDQAVGVFLDEVYIGRTGGLNFDLFDLDHVEILRGPQGTLYGKNTNGGAINIVTKKPTRDDEVVLSASAGNYGMWQLQALLNGGVTDSIAGKLVVSAKQHDGYGKNVITGSEIKTLGNLSNSVIIGDSIGAKGNGDRLDDGQNLSIRGQLLFDLNDATKLLLGADYTEDHSNGSCRHLQNLDQAIMGLGAFWRLGMSDAYLKSDRNCSTQFNTDQDRSTGGVLARLDYDASWSTLTSITAWRSADYKAVDDLTGIPLNNLAALPPPGVALPPGAYTAPENVIDGVDQYSSQFSQEFRVTGTSGRFDWVAGAYYLQEKVNRDEEYYTQYSRLLQGLGLAPIGDVLFTQDNTTTTEALYGQAGWRFADRWTLTYGLRWSQDKKDITQDAIDLLNGAYPRTGVPLILPEFPAPVKASKTWSKLTNRVSLEFRPSNGFMLFATYAEGFKSGAFPSQANLPSVAGQAVPPEIVKNTEGGFKSTWWDGRAHLNMSYYYMDYTDLQVFELNSRLLLVLSSAEARSEGLDVEFNVALTDALRLAATYNHSDAKYTHFITSSGQDVSGNDMTNAPDNAYTVDAAYTLPVDVAGKISVDLSYAWKDKIYRTVQNVPKAMQPATGLLNAGVNWTSQDGSWQVSAWGRNLTDEQQLSHLIVDPTGITSEFYLAPRTYGLTVTKTF